MTRKDIIKHIINTYNPTNAEEFEILGRAIKGCEVYGYRSKNRYTNADWQALRLVEQAIKEIKLCIE